MNPSPQHRTEQLRAAFAEFEDASQQLSAFYRDLEREVAVLAEELARSRAAEARELAEKRRLSARLASLLDALPAGVVVLDQHGNVQESNPAASELLGTLAAGTPWAGIAARAFAPRWDDGHDLSLADGRRVNLATQALAGEPGQILLIRDVSETRRLQDSLAHHKRLSAQTEMAAALAHQIRTPLASALLSAGNLRRARSEAERERAAGRAIKSLRKLERLVDEMLLFARGGKLDVVAVDAADLMAAIASAHAEAAAPDGYTVTLGPAPAAAVYVNLAALTSIALNLIDNASQACNGNGRLAITARDDDGMLEIAFADDGPGVPGAEHARIFEPFHSTRPNGTGLGLPVARAVARAHGGDLTLAPAAAAGACFVLRLPLIAAGAQPSPPVTALPALARAATGVCA